VARGERGAARRRARAPDPALNGSLLAQGATHEYQVAAVHRVGAELALQVLGGAMRECQNKHAGGVAVEPVDNQHSAMAASAALDLRRGTGEHRVLLASERGVDQQAGGLDDHHDIVVKMQ